MKRKLIVHPYFFVIYAVIGVYSRNSAEIPVQWIMRPLLVLLLLMAVTFSLFQLILKDSQHAGLASTLALFWFFFGHFHRTLLEQSVFWDTRLGVILAFAVWTIPLTMLGSKQAWARISNRNLVTSFLNLTSVFVVLMPLYLTGSALIQTIWQTRAYKTHQEENALIDLDVRSSQPDIYLIILDAYGREDFLKDIYGFDNGEFIDFLEERGFYVANQSTPNYPQTGLSLSSLLNMQYLDGFTKGFQNTNIRGPINDLLQNSEVRRSLRNAGYKFVALPSATLFTQIRNADVYYKITLGDLNEFEGLLLSSTIANLAIDVWGLDVPVPSYALHRRYILFSLDTLENVAGVNGPKFVFAHIMAPHPPFVLDESGFPVQSVRPYNMGDASGFMGTHEEYTSDYVGELRYLNERLMKVVDAILVQSKQPPIIIIQGDHGPGNYFNMVEPDNECLRERYSILNAYYFPDGNYGDLYPMITPVNSFRIVLNRYFGTNLELLVDRNYYATWLKPYIFYDVSDRIHSCNINDKN